MKKNIKRAAVILMAVLMLVTAIPLNGIVGADLFAEKASAAKLAPTGQCGENAFWTFDSETGLLTISGEGAINDYSHAMSPFYYNDSIKSVVINDGITSIGSYIFEPCRGLTSVIISDSVMSIGKDAFSGCTGLTSITIPDSVVNIGDYAFSGCKNLTSIIIPVSVVSIGDSVFSRCEGLTSITVDEENSVYDSRNSCNAIIETKTNTLVCGCKNTVIPEDVTSIDDSAFSGCTGLSNIIIPESITKIGSSAFSLCTGLTSISLSDSVTEIGNYAFYGCTGLTDITMSKSVTSMGDGVFCYCESLKSVIIPDGVTYIGYDTFASCTALTNITIPDGVTDIGSSAFSECKKIQSIVIPNSVISIGNTAFSGCENLKSIIIPDGVTNIGHMAFARCIELTSVTFPESVISIGDNVFDGCINLTSIIIEADNIVYDSRNNCNAIIETETNTLICGCKNTVIPEDIASIYDSAFANCTGLTRITIPESVISIGDFAFGGCTNLKSVMISDSIVNIGIAAFEYCTGLTNITIPNSVTSIELCAFFECTGLTSVTIPDCITRIGDMAFEFCDSLKDVYYSGSESQWNDMTVGSYNECLLNANIHFSDGRTIGTCGENINWTYDGSNGNLVVSGTGAMDSYESFDDYSWYSFKDDINYVEFSDGITSIGANAFNGCTALKEVYFGKNTAAIGENAFADCTNLSIVTVTSDSFTAENAFSNNSSRLTFVVADGNISAESFAKNSGYPVITAGYSDEENTVYFKGNTIVYKSLQYNYLTNYINEYSYAEYIHFDRLEFDGIMPDVIFIEDCENIVSGTKNFALNDLYVSLKVVVDGREEQITFEKMFELLESGNYDAFKLKFQSESGETEESFFEKVVEFFDNFFTSALSAISRAINAIVKLFKKK